MSVRNLYDEKETHGIEFDGMGYESTTETDSEAESSTTPPVDWVGEAVKVKNRLESPEQPGYENKAIGHGMQRAPSVENVNLETQTPLQDPNDDVKQSILKKGADTYEMEKYEKNAMIVFNHEKFLGSDKVRNYTMKDEEALKTTFSKFGFIVESHLDLRKTILIQKLKEFCSKDFSQYGCICAVIMTHGAKNGWLRAYDIRYSEHEFMDCFDVKKNTSILGKPVIILIQACRGDEPANAVSSQTPKSEEEIEFDFDEPYTLPAEADRLIFHSSYIGRASVRATEGTWFIQALCHQIDLFGHVDDFETICRAVRRNVAIEKQHKMTKQMPVVTTCLTRLLYLKKYEGTDENDSVCRNIKCAEAIKKSTLDAYPEKLADTNTSACNEYFEYLKKTLRLYINENPDDDVAQSILKVAENDQNVNGNNSVTAEVADLIRTYLSKNMDRFSRSDLVYLGRSCCCSTQIKPANENWCSIL